MEKIGKNFFWIVMCVALLIVHLGFIIFDVNIYKYLFWPYIVVVVGVVLFAVILFSKMEKIMTELGPDVAILQYKKILSSIPFWWMSVLFISLLYLDIYILGQFFMESRHVPRILLQTDGSLAPWIVLILTFSSIFSFIVGYLLESRIKEIK